MDTMRTYGSGSFDLKARRWRVKTEGIKATINDLRYIYGESVPDTKAGSAPFWTRFLSATRQARQQQQAKTSPLQTRIASLDRVIGTLTEEGNAEAVAVFQAERERCIAVEPWAPGRIIFDTPVAHPVAVAHGEALGIVGDSPLNTDFEKLAYLESITVKPTPIKESLRHEIESYLTSKEKRSTAQKKEVPSDRKALDILLSITGDIPFRSLDATHYRAFVDKITADPDDSDRTKFNKQARVKTFLKLLEADYSLNFGFLRNAKYNLECPDGDKEQYTLEQVKLAVEKATGQVRELLSNLVDGQLFRRRFVPPHRQTVPRR